MGLLRDYEPSDGTFSSTTLQTSVRPLLNTWSNTGSRAQQWRDVTLLLLSDTTQILTIHHLVPAKPDKLIINPNVKSLSQQQTLVIGC